MKLLFDHNVDRRFRRHILGHEISTTREMGWETLANGRLLKTAAAAGFEVFLSIDKKIEHEQNLRTLPRPVVIVDAPSNALPALIPFAPYLLDLFPAPLDRLADQVDHAGLDADMPSQTRLRHAMLAQELTKEHSGMRR